MGNLIDPQFVTVQQLVNIFNNAYIKVIDVKENVLTIIIDKSEFFVLLTPSECRIQIIDYFSIGSRTKLKEHEHSLFEFINTLNRKYIGKYYLSYHENSEKEEFVFFQTDHESSYTFGLNPAQLIADCHSLKQNIKDIGKQFVDMLYEKGIYK